MQTRSAEVEGVEVRVTSYRVGHRWSCRVDNVDPGGNIARATGDTRELAEKAATEGASLTLALARLRRAIESVTKAIGGSGEGERDE